jgi:pilus assembly protein Flp/PilA
VKNNLKKKGQGLVEYALILVLVAIVVIVVLTVLGKKVNQVMSGAASGLGPLYPQPTKNKEPR